MNYSVRLERWPLLEPVSITGYTFTDVEVVLVTLTDGHCFGRGEGCGVYYRGESAQEMLLSLEGVRSAVEAGLSRAQLRDLMPPGSARNALDSALWELECQRSGQEVWQLAGLSSVRPILTTRTVWGDTPERMADAACGFGDAPIIKLKLLGDPTDAARVRAVRAALPLTRLVVDANQGFNRASFDTLLSVLVDARVEMVEQPFPMQHDEWLDGLGSPIPIAADESMQGLEDMSQLAGRFDMINIKLDKCGGLTEALLMVAEARRLDLQIMVGCMTSTSLSMAPAFVLAQFADLADVDAPLYITADRPFPARYTGSRLTIPDELWGPRALSF